MKFQKLIAAFVIPLFLISCKQSESDKVAEAQNCLNESSSSNVHLCLNIIDGINSQKAHSIRCSVSFIQQGFDQADKFINALEGLESSTGGQGDSLLGMLGTLSFPSQDSANLAVSRCEKSGSSSLLKLSNLSKMATTLASLSSVNIASGDIPSQADMNAALANVSGDPVAQTQLGQTVLSLNENCESEGSLTGSNKEICDKIKTTLDDATQSNGGQTPTAEQIGSALANYLATEH